MIKEETLLKIFDEEPNELLLLIMGAMNTWKSGRISEKEFVTNLVVSIEKMYYRKILGEKK
ncbi:MAG: hypothetical protein AABY22_21060 [Nanoarchaeota archaeon]